MIVEVFFGSLALFYARCASGCTTTVRKYTVRKGAFFFILVRCIWPIDRHYTGLC